MTDFHTVATVRKNNTEEVRVRVTAGANYPLVDMRVFSAIGRRNGEPVSTKAGICVPRNQLPALIEALQAAEREASR